MFRGLEYVQPKESKAEHQQEEQEHIGMQIALLLY
jgi:hypothetical protein